MVLFYNTMGTSLMGSASKLTYSCVLSEAQHAGTFRSQVAHSFVFDLGFVIYDSSLAIISLRKRQLVALL